MFVGAVIYSFEIPNYFAWIDRRTVDFSGVKKMLVKTGLAIAYFNPFWIFRHIFFIKLFSGNFAQINASLFVIALYSFAVNIPISFVANYIIQNKIKLNWRFMASAVFSGLMAIYYAFSETLFQ